MNALNEKRARQQLILRRFMQILFTGFLWALFLFLSAGRLAWPNAWVYLGIYAAMILANASLMYARDPALIAERARQGEGVKPWDRFLAGAMSLYGPALVLLIAGLNERFGWQPRPGLPLQVAAGLLVVLGYAGWGWAMHANPFFAGMVRIQKERQHRAVAAGPYRIVRHPGYAAFIGFTLGIPCMLGSFWGLLPAGLTAAVVVIRASLEDETLRAELEGYEGYAGSVRWRLFPGIW